MDGDKKWVQNMFEKRVVTDEYWMRKRGNILNSTGSILSPGYSRILQDTLEYSKILQDTPDYSRILQDTPEYSRILQDTPGYSRIF